MKFYSDRPIKKIKQDSLNRSKFAIQLADAIMNYNYQESLVLGILGEWGTGKTSVINMIIDHILSSLLEEEQPIIINFNPWNYSEQDKLLLQFFDSISVALKRNKIKGIKKISEYIDSYSNLLRPAKYIPGVGQIIDTGIDVLQTVGKSIREKDIKEVEEIRKKLDQYLLKTKKKIIIVIDDIDRLNSNEIKQIFQLAKKLADFPNTIYLLSFSQEVIVEALKGIQFGDGYDYLKKIVQLQFNLPPANAKDTENVLFAGLNEILEEVKEDFDKDYWAKIYTDSLKYFFETIRDVNRFLNVLKFKLGLLKGEINPVDLIAIIVIEIFLPQLYAFMRNNKDKFAGVVGNDSLLYGSVTNYKEILKKEFEPIVTDNLIVPEHFQKYTKNLLVKLFPKWESIYGYYTYTSMHLPDLVKKCRIASTEFYDRYFYLSVPSDSLSKIEFDNIIKQLGDKKLLEKSLLNLSKRGLFKDFLDRLDIDKDNIDKINIQNLIDILIDLGDRWEFKLEFDISSIPNDLRLMIVITNLLKLIENKQMRFEMLKQSIERSMNSIYIPVKLIVDNGLQHGRFTNEPPLEPGNQLLELEDVLKLEKIGVKKLKEWSSNGKLLKVPSLPFLLYRWQRFNGDSDVITFINDAISTNQKLIKFIVGFKYSIDSNLSGSIKRSYDLHYTDLGKFIDVKSIEPRVRKIFKNNIKELNDDEKEALKLFLDYFDGKLIERN